MAVGVHPTAALGEAVIASSPRYDRIVDEYAGLLRTPTAALQVHVGFPDEQTLMLAYRGLRHRLPLLRALAAGIAVLARAWTPGSRPPAPRSCAPTPAPPCRRCCTRGTSTSPAPRR